VKRNRLTEFMWAALFLSGALTLAWLTHAPWYLGVVLGYFAGLASFPVRAGSEETP
jgi:hypothetical protein